MHQLQDKGNIHLLQPSYFMRLSFRLNLWLEHWASSNSILCGLASKARKAINTQSALNPLRPMPKLGGVAAIHRVDLWEREKPSGLTLASG